MMLQSWDYIWSQPKLKPKQKAFKRLARELKNGNAYVTDCCWDCEYLHYYWVIVAKYHGGIFQVWVNDRPSWGKYMREGL